MKQTIFREGRMIIGDGGEGRTEGVHHAGETSGMRNAIHTTRMETVQGRAVVR